jgi:hypothetical protein
MARLNAAQRRLMTTSFEPVWIVTEVPSLV